MDREKIIIKTSVQGIIVNIVLVIFKSIVGFIANSIAIVLDALNNFSDVLSSVITIIGAKLANKKPDKEHPYGHGRIEYFASILIGVIILVAGLTALKESLEKIINPVKAHYTAASLIVVIVATIAKLFLGNHVKKVGEEIDSGSLVASGADALFDAVISSSTLIAAIISMTLGYSVEGILGAVISIIIIKSSIELLKDTINSVIGIRVEKEIVMKIKKIINSYEEVEGCYDLMLHNYGPNKVVGSTHIQVKDELTAKEIHVLSRKIETKVYKKLGIILTVGIYASNNSDEKISAMKKTLEDIIIEYPTIMQLHGFYVDENNVSFDLIVSFNDKNPEETVKQVVKDMKAKYPDYKYYPIIDTDISD